MTAEFGDREAVWGSPELICVVEKIKIFLPALLVRFFSAGPEPSPVLSWNSVIWDGCSGFCFSRFKPTVIISV